MPTQGGERGERVTEPPPSGSLQELLDRLEETRARLEEIDDPGGAVEVLNELNDLAREVQGEIDRMRREGPGD